MYKVLVVGMSDNYGGIENIIFNYYSNFDRTKIHFDFCKSTKKKIAYEDKLVEWGSKIFYVPSKNKNIFLYKKYINLFFKRQAVNYDCIWINRNDLVNIDYLKLAKKYNIPRRIIHSHNVQVLDNGISSKIKNILHYYNKRRIYKYATDFWACTDMAAKWFYNNFEKVVIIKNAIDINRFTFNEIKRKKLRKKLNLNNSCVIGNIGRLDYQKNQEFLINIFSNFIQLVPNAKLVLIGQGKDKVYLEQLVNKLALNDKVLFLGMKANIQNWYNVFDYFVFPSRFEGLGIVGVEAQANGLPCFASSNKIPQDLKINKNFYFISLNKTAKFWAEEIKRTRKERVNMDEIKSNFEKSGYSLTIASQKLQDLFISKEKNR